MLFRSESRGGGVMDRIGIALARAFDLGRDDGITVTADWLYNAWKDRDAGDEPEPDLSGEWADSPTPASVLVQSLAFVGIRSLDQINHEELDWLQSEVCDEYDAGFRHGREWIKASETWRGVVAAR
jgi:hypothetical protein